MTAVLSGPMFERDEDEYFKSVSGKSGAHYNSYYIKPHIGMKMLRELFPDGEANEYNMVLFSTSGVHGTYLTIEEIESGLRKHGDDPQFNSDWPDDYHGNSLTVLIVHPRICTLRHGNVEVTLADIPFLKKLRETSHRELAKIGNTESQ
jgi:hypothetical protein